MYRTTRRHALCVACHRDLHPGNVIYNQERFWAIDYTWGGMDDPYSDLATISIFHCIVPEDDELLLQLYLGHKPNSQQTAHLSLMKVPTKLFYALEFLKLSPLNAVKPKAEFKSYMNFGYHHQPRPTPDDLLQYAVTLLDEVLDYSISSQYAKDLTTMVK